MTSIEKLIEIIENELESAWQLPMSGGRIVIDPKEVLKMIEEVKKNLPDEIVQAKKIVQDRSEIIGKAKSEAESMMKASEERVRQLVNQSEIVRSAKTKAEDIIDEANSKAKELRISSNEYARNTMKELDEAVTNSLDQIRKVRNMFNK